MEQMKTVVTISVLLSMIILGIAFKLSVRRNDPYYYNVHNTYMIGNVIILTGLLSYLIIF
jgi:hypothetical protein